MSCESCHISERGMQEQFSNVVKQAKHYALEQEKTMAVYREGYEYRFCEAGVAIQQGYVIVQVVSKHH